MGDLPAWVYDMVMRLDQWHEEHGKLYVQASSGAVIPADDCGCSALDRVPPGVLAKAKAIRGYLAAKGELDTVTGEEARP